MKIDDASAIFDAQHPEIWEMFVRFTSVLIGVGFQHHSARAVFHRIRWETGVNSGGQPYKINNNYSPYYARKFHREFPQHAGFFRNRIARADITEEDDDG